MRTSIRTALATAVTVSLTGGLLGLTAGTATAAAPAKAAKTVQPYDFNGDGIRDYTIDVYDRVIVTYGTATGPGTETFTFDQNSPGIPGERADEMERFGFDQASADFNGDGYADLAVSDPNESVGEHAERGMVVIVWGSESGLGSKASTIDPTSPQTDQGFGQSLVTGDFSGDGKPDLAVADDRAVHVHRGGFSSETGATGKVSTFTPPKGSGLRPERLAAGNVTKDKATDLYVLGFRFTDDYRYVTGTWFLKGGSTIKPGKPKMAAKATRDSARHGVVADFDKDGYGDLAYDDYTYKGDAGSVVVLRGGKNGPTTSYRLTQDTPGVATAATEEDSFGTSLSVGDTNRDGYPDLAIGTNETLGPDLGDRDIRGHGGAHVLHGGKKGLTGAGSKWFTRDTPGIPGKARPSAGFGSQVRLHDFDRDGDADLLLSEAGPGNMTREPLLSGGRSGITTKNLREVPLKATFPQ
ncbi:FG-GAP and VCBS repeat-containing protein [Streptomyces jumonjinensis]|uniref:FG-GAP and VCBS repeat-containing protein n=1 Tax=Streptomyces jumonjinensis TaxID=1945 RepID=UPI00379BED15